ncbi:MAG TPA: glycogen debranching protein GlgX [Steroidobacteraceae bacterium]|nr:glycogen debranching protein GlgX [Steroidobacteraceae bacterium]
MIANAAVADVSVAASTILPGRSFPLGAEVVDGGVNFSVFSKAAEKVELLLFAEVDAERPSRIIELDSRTHRTWQYWHVFVSGLRAGQAYGYRAFGPFAPARGMRFDGEKLLLDPYARCIVAPPGRDRLAACQPGDNTAAAYRCVIAEPCSYDWEGDLPPRTPYHEMVIYEMHVGHFTRDPSSGVARARRGTYAGVIEQIPYLTDLGVSAVELLPVFAFDEQAAPAGRRNVWGYQPVSFFAPHPGYSAASSPLAVLDEFRDMVKALHRAGIEVILDVVYNHTAEGGADGPTLGFRGFANETYYILDRTRGGFVDYTGCGNSLDANETVVRRMILDSLRYWVREMHVDGFRFDLAAVLSRDEEGNPIASPPVLRDIESDPVLANVKLIAEAWDATGTYQVGHFVDNGWSEWNGRFRDDMRRFVKGDERTVRTLSCRIAGSPDIYGPERRSPAQSVNFVTCHDGFTLADLVSYDRKHNENNLAGNRDGADENFSWNCGAEGPTEDNAIQQLRARQVRNFLTLTLLSVGTPMLLMGDELGRTQDGNNNGYCLDGEAAWVDWKPLAGRGAGLHRFVRGLIALRTGRGGAPSRIEWHGVRLAEPDWSDSSHSLAATMHFSSRGMMLHWLLNAYWQPLSFELPPAQAGFGPWRRAVDTYRNSPQDICLGADAPPVNGTSIVVEPRSCVVLLSDTLKPDQPRRS